MLMLLLHPGGHSWRARIVAKSYRVGYMDIKYKYVYLEPKWGPLFCLKFGPCFGGFFRSKIEVIWALGIFINIYIYKSHMPGMITY